ncbi:MAG TPA: CBS domain-containing protein [Dehalococcoidia bacterium]|jgi:CBS domain-containing protein|nr:CBS domain-containing protein [Dehalococcoidia bacterium]
MICPSCHAENIEGADECSHCGAALYGLDLPGASHGAKAPAFIQQSIAGLPKRAVVKVGLSDPVGLAVRHMQRQDINCVLVMDGEKVAGILTGWDILQKVAGPREDLNAVTCGQVMTASPVVLHDEDTIAMAIHLMAAGGIQNVPVLKGDEPTGILVSTDVFRQISPHLV